MISGLHFWTTRLHLTNLEKLPLRIRILIICTSITVIDVYRNELAILFWVLNFQRWCHLVDGQIILWYIQPSVIGIIRVRSLYLTCNALGIARWIVTILTVKDNIFLSINFWPTRKCIIPLLTSIVKSLTFDSHVTIKYEFVFFIAYILVSRAKILRISIFAKRLIQVS